MLIVIKKWVLLVFISFVILEVNFIQAVLLQQQRSLRERYPVFPARSLPRTFSSLHSIRAAAAAISFFTLGRLLYTTSRFEFRSPPPVRKRNESRSQSTPVAAAVRPPRQTGLDPDDSESDEVEFYLDQERLPSVSLVKSKTLRQSLRNTDTLLADLKSSVYELLLWKNAEKSFIQKWRRENKCKMPANMLKSYTYGIYNANFCYKEALEVPKDKDQVRRVMTLAVMSLKYIGKGCDDRFASHLAKAIAAIRSDNLARAEKLVGDKDTKKIAKKGIVEVLKDAGHTIGFVVFREGLFE